MHPLPTRKTLVVLKNGFVHSCLIRTLRRSMLAFPAHQEDTCTYNCFCAFLFDKYPEEEHACIPCPPGRYIDRNTTACTQCPPDTTVSDPLAYGEESCEPCGPGLSSTNGIECTTNCIFNIDGMQYDFHSLAR